MTTRDLDAWILRIVTLLGADGDDAYVVEKALRMGALSSPPADVGTAAEKLHTNRRTLLKRMVKAKLPAPSRLLMWGRLLPMMAHYARGGTIEQVAWLNGLDQSSLSASVLAHSGMKASEWRRGGADMDVLLRAFVETHRLRVAA